MTADPDPDVYELWDSTEDDPLCEFVRHWTDGTTAMCAAPANWRGTAGCVHEHVGTRDLCDQHAEYIRGGGRVTCGLCHPDHYCQLLTARVEPIAA